MSKSNRKRNLKRSVDDEPFAKLDKIKREHKRKRKNSNQPSSRKVSRKFLLPFLLIVGLSAGCFFGYRIYKITYGLVISKTLATVSAQLNRYLDLNEQVELIVKHGGHASFDNFIKEKLIPIQAKVGSVRNRVLQYEKLLSTHKMTLGDSNFVKTTKEELTAILDSVFNELDVQLLPIHQERIRLEKKYSEITEEVFSYNEEFTNLMIEEGLMLLERKKFGFIPHQEGSVILASELRKEKDVEKVFKLTKETLGILYKLEKYYAMQEEIQRKFTADYCESFVPQDIWEIGAKIFLAPCNFLMNVDPLFKIFVLEDLRNYFKYHKDELKAERLFNWSTILTESEKIIKSDDVFKLENVMNLRTALQKLSSAKVYALREKLEGEDSYLKLKKNINEDLVNLYTRVEKMV